MEVGRRFPAGGRLLSGEKTRGFGGEKWRRCVAVVAVVDARLGNWWPSSRRRRVADGSDARRRPLVAGERKRESDERVRERGALGESGLRCPISIRPSPFCSISFFF